MTAGSAILADRCLQLITPATVDTQADPLYGYATRTEPFNDTTSPGKSPGNSGARDGPMPLIGSNTPASPFWSLVQRLPLSGKLALVLVSIAGYWLSVVLAAAADQDAADWIVFLLHRAPGVIFGLLVMGPYVARSPFALRLIAMAVASAVIYYLAVGFVIGGPFSYNTITPYLIAGGTAASLVAMSTMLLAPRAWRWMPVLIAAIAGTAGGVLFEWDPLAGSEWFALLVPHAAWQVLVCLALHLGLRSTSS